MDIIEMSVGDSFIPRYRRHYRFQQDLGLCPSIAFNITRFSVPGVPSHTGALSHHPNSGEGMPLDRLSSEILALIFTELRAMDIPSLRSLRLVSKRFDAIVTPILYSTVQLNRSAVRPDAETRYSGLYTHMSAYTTRVIVKSSLDPVGIKKALANIQRLQSICWRCDEGATNASQLPSDVLDQKQIELHGTKICVENLRMTGFHPDRLDSYTRVLPARHLVSLKMASPSPDRVVKWRPLKRLLLDAPHLESFHHYDRGRGGCFRFEAGERFPPFKDLMLRCYDWDHSRSDVARHWDFSKMQHLRLWSVPLCKFLESIHLHDFVHLRTLQLEDYSPLEVKRRREAATRQLFTLVNHHVKALEELSISCFIRLFPIHGITKHGKTLRHLRFRDHSYHMTLVEEMRDCPTMSASEIAMLATQLPYLESLEVDMNIFSGERDNFLRAVCLFRNLDSLTLHMRSVLEPFEAVRPGRDRDHGLAMAIFYLLAEYKAEFRSAVPWHRITINIGEWRRIRARRLSKPFAKPNTNKSFEERRIVVENDEDGMLTLRGETEPSTE